MIPEMEKKSSIPWNLWSDVSGSETWDDQVPQPILLPSSLEAREWKRFHEIENVTPVLYDSTDSPDLFSNNQHLLQSEFIKWFCSTLKILNYCHEVGGKRWQGWHHIYSPNKSLKESEHNPQLNPDGKYMVKLFFMGFWRCFPVDDTIPQGYDGMPLLPRTQNTNELWPMILAKAVWQIASLSAINDREIADFNSFLSFTGWTWLSQNITHLSPRDRWELLIKYSGNHNGSQSPTVSTVETPTKNTVSKIPTDKRKIRRTSKKRGPSETATKEDEKMESTGSETKEDFPILTLLYLHDNGAIRKDHDEVPEIPSGYPIYLESTSDRPADPTQIKPPIEAWKLPRWVSWAVRQGIIDPKDHFSPTRRILILPPEAPKPEPHWLDFNEFTGHPMHCHFLFKREYFRCSKAVSNMPHPHPDPKTGTKIEEKPNKTRKPSDQKISTENFPHHFHPLKPSRNEPLYLLVDSTEQKLFLFNFCVCGEHRSSLIIEKCCWFRRNSGNKNLLSVQTKGCASRAICLSPGRHLLKVFCQSRGYYYLTVSSDTIFCIGGRREVQDLMTAESERTKALVDDVRRKLATAFHSWGSPSHLMDWRNFCESYMPRGSGDDVKLSKGCRLRIHEAFRAEALGVIEGKCRGELRLRARRALRIFFMMGDGVERRTSGLGDQSADRGESGGSAGEIGGEAAAKIQGFFRMLRVKKFFGIRMGRRGHEGLSETLQEVLEVFDEETVGDLVRSFIRGMQDFMGFYDCNSDFEHVLRIQKMRGRTLVSSPEWIPMVRRNLMVRGEEVVFAVMDLFVDLPGYSLRCFDNDTKREIQRAVNNVIPFHYGRNWGGFTVLGYGRSDQERMTEVEWTLHITTIKGSPQFHSSNNPLPPITEEANPVIYELSNIYIPNSNNYVAKAILKVSNSCTVSMRLQASYPKTRIKLRVLSETSERLQEVSGGSVVLLPVVNLTDCELEYFIHAFVLGDSWPLTEDEWRCVEKAKRDLEQKILMERPSSSPARSFVREKRTSRKIIDCLLEGPCWSLQILCDPEITVEFREDTTREHEILRTKMLWKSQDPGRSERGKNLQEQFRAENCIQPYDFELYEGEGEYQSNLAIDEEVRTLSPPRDHRRLPPLNLSLFQEAPDMRTISQEPLKKKIQRRKLLKFEEKSRHLMQHLEMAMISSLRVPTK